MSHYSIIIVPTANTFAFLYNRSVWWVNGSKKEEKQACTLAQILYFSSFTSECIFRSESRLAVTALSQKSLHMQWPSFFRVRETERGAVEASARWDRCHTLLHSVELWRGVSTGTVQRRWGLSPVPALRSTAVPTASPGMEPHGLFAHLGSWLKGLGAMRQPRLMAWCDLGELQRRAGGPSDGTWKMIHEY